MLKPIRDFVQLYINNEKVKVYGDDVLLPLSDFLRNSLSLKGTKVVCAEGDCGACTVLTGKTDDKKSYSSINSCIIPVALLDNQHVITIEGIKNNNNLHEVQKQMVDNNGAQCGFCSPGIVMSLVDLFENKSAVDEKDCRNYLTGNLCRCTGYGPILDAALSVDQNKVIKMSSIYSKLTFESETSGISIKTKTLEFYSPASLDEAVALKTKYPDIRLISSATDIGVQINKERFNPHRLMSLELIRQAHEVEESKDHYSFGARVTLSKMEKFYKKEDSEFSSFLNIFASPQIKNTATLVGNVANASPIGDTLPFLLVMNAQVVLIGPDGERKVSMNDFYKGYKKLDMKKDEFILKIIIPKRTKGERLKLYKVSRRKDLDISCVNAAVKMKLKDNNVEDIQIAFGGVGPTVLRLKKLEKTMKGMPFDASSFRKGSVLVDNEISPMSDVRGSEQYRRLVAKNLFQRFFLEVSKDLSCENI